MIEIFIDTNPFIRYFTNDLPERAERVDRLFKRAQKREIKLVTNELIVAEIVWVLESVYELEREMICNLLEAIFNTTNLEIQNKAILRKAVETYKDKNIDFVDAYTASYMEANGIKKLYSFD